MSKKHAYLEKAFIYLSCELSVEYEGWITKIVMLQPLVTVSIYYRVDINSTRLNTNENRNLLMSVILFYNCN